MKLIEIIQDKKSLRIMKNNVNNQEIPDYELAVVVGNRYANWYHTGYILGSNHKDSNIKNASLKQTVEFLQNGVAEE